MENQAVCELCQPVGDILVSTVEWRVILVDDPHYPGFCRVIWNDHVREMTDLTALQRARLMDVVWQVEMSIREVMQPSKVNLASFGNVVPHVHWHVIPRFADDMHFPNPIWGQVERSINPAMQQRHTLLPKLRAAIQARWPEN